MHFSVSKLNKYSDSDIFTLFLADDCPDHYLYFACHSPLTSYPRLQVQVPLATACLPRQIASHHYAHLISLSLATIRTTRMRTGGESVNPSLVLCPLTTGTLLEVSILFVLIFNIY